MRRRFLFLIGIIIIASGVAMLAKIPYFYYHSHTVGKQLVEQFYTDLSTNAEKVSNFKVLSKREDTKSKKPDQQIAGLIGEIKIPSLSLTAPIVEGTEDNELSVAVGHLKTSSLPGKIGTCILAAHNATWFRHVDKLKIGDTMQVDLLSGTYKFKVTDAKVVHVGENIPNTSYSSIILESCYPLDALYLTQERYLVYGKLIK